MFRVFGFQASRSQRSIQSSTSRTSTYTQSTSASSLPLALSRSTSLSSRTKGPPNKYQSVILFLFALVLFSLAPTFRLTARTHAKYTSITKQDSDTHIPPGAHSPALSNEFTKGRVNTLSALSVHRISEVLFEMIHNEELTSLVAYPCHKHLAILRSLSQLLNMESSHGRSSVFCVDSSSAELAEAHSVLREEGYAFDIKFIRGDLTKQPPPKASIFLRIDNEHVLETTSLTGLLMSVKESGAQTAIIHALPNKNGDWESNGDYQNAPFPLADHIEHIKSLEYGFVLVYDLLSMTRHRNETEQSKRKAR